MMNGHLQRVQMGYGTPTEAEYELALSGHAAVLTPGGSIFSCRVTPSQRAALKEAQQVGYLLTKESWKSTPLLNAHDLLCSMQCRPTPVVMTHGRLAYITLNFRFTPRDLQPTEVIYLEAGRFISSFKYKPDWPQRARPSVFLGHEHWSASHVPVAFADEMIRGLLAIAMSASKGGAE